MPTFKHSNTVKDFYFSPQGQKLLSYMPWVSLIAFTSTLYLNYYLFTSLSVDQFSGDNPVNFTLVNPKYCEHQFQKNQQKDDHQPEFDITQFRILDSSLLFKFCSDIQLCEISYYGGWPGSPYLSFRIGMTITVFFLVILVEGRRIGWIILLTQYKKMFNKIQKQQQQLQREEIQENLQIENDKLKISNKTYVNNSIDHTIYDEHLFKQIKYYQTKLRILSLTAYLSVFSIFPMAFIPFYEGSLHFISALSVFFFLAVSQFFDTNILYFVNKLEKGDSFQDKWGKLYLRFTNFGGMVCMGLWVIYEVDGGSYFEYMAAILPFFYFIPWIEQYKWQKKLIDQNNQILNL